MKRIRSLPSIDRSGESLKIALRRFLHRHNLDLVRNPYTRRLATALGRLRLDCVIDVGANVGQYAIALRSGGFAGAVVSVEPLADAYAELERRARGDDRWRTVHAALGRERGRVTLNRSQNSVSSSVLPMTHTHLAAAPRSRVIDTEDVEVTTVDALITDLGLEPRRTLLKVDTQGYESAVLDGASSTLRDLAAVQLELSLTQLYDGQELAEPLVERMRQAGFVVYDLEPGFTDATTGRLLQVDALFVAGSLAGAPPS